MFFFNKKKKEKKKTKAYQFLNMTCMTCILPAVSHEWKQVINNKELHSMNTSYNNVFCFLFFGGRHSTGLHNMSPCPHAITIKAYYIV